MDAASSLLALRLAGQDHALEPDRDYVLGTDAVCDLRLPAGVAAQQAQLVVKTDRLEVVHLGGDVGTFRNGERVERAALAAGDVLRFGDGERGAEAVVVRDDGQATIVPIPALRAAANQRRVRIAARALRFDRDASFRRMVAHELRSPWFPVSLTLHVLLLVLVWLLSTAPPISGRAQVTVSVDLASGPLDAAQAPPAPPDVIPEPADTSFEAFATPEPPVTPDDDRARTTDRAATEPDAALRQNPRIGVRTAPPAQPAPPAGGGGLDGIGSGDFRRTVGDLRKSGLEIVFVFDSTGSMTRTILDTKATIAQMLAVLQAIVPDARVGLVTFRDRGRHEQYVVRQVALGVDFWRLTNFMQTVTADGGGDLPEEVRGGLRAAFGQDWRPSARRVVVLAGDAPPHDEDTAKLLNEVRMFAGNGRSFVHTLITSPDESRSETLVSFTAIAKAGNGICERIHSRERVLQRVLTLAFGREFDRDVAAVIRAVEDDARRVDVKALDLARRGGPDLARELKKAPVSQTLWNALVRRPRRATVDQLVTLLGASDTPDSSRQAIAAALQRILDLPLPPIDCEGDERTAPRELERLRRAAERVPE